MIFTKDTMQPMTLTEAAKLNDWDKVIDKGRL